MRRLALASLGLAALVAVFLLLDSGLGIAPKTIVVMTVALVAAIVFAILSDARKEQ